ncbi:hypothetical protein SFRURICE_009361 [Spodoptera frugiperda]|nr:hypothetical protein SFRURICE_009361 [Spodoptera frugiperda]
MKPLFLKLILLYLAVKPSNLQLVINVRNQTCNSCFMVGNVQGGDVMQENITANVSEDTITLEFMRLDGVFVSQLVDFTNEVEAMKLIIPGEEELGQTGHQTLKCNINQKNPGTIRVAEEDKGWRQTTASAWAGRAVRLLSAPAARHCAAARDRVYLRAADLARWAPRPGLDQSSYATVVTPFPPHALSSDTTDGKLAVGACVSETDRTKECICHLEVCVNWYPCGLKYCKGKPQGGLSYRCGIKTCHRCYRYHFYVNQRDTCLTYT